MLDVEHADMDKQHQKTVPGLLLVHVFFACTNKKSRKKTWNQQKKRTTVLKHKRRRGNEAHLGPKASAEKKKWNKHKTAEEEKHWSNLPTSRKDLNQAQNWLANQSYSQNGWLLICSILFYYFCCRWLLETDEKHNTCTRHAKKHKNHWMHAQLTNSSKKWCEKYTSVLNNKCTNSTQGLRD